MAVKDKTLSYSRELITELLTYNQTVNDNGIGAKKEIVSQFFLKSTSFT